MKSKYQSKPNYFCHNLLSMFYFIASQHLFIMCYTSYSLSACIPIISIAKRADQKKKKKIEN